ncbi:MAG: amidohydrolase family protein [Candidatus Limnocylindrales bacterium]
MSAPDLIIFNGRLFRGSLPGNAYLPGSAAGPAVADAPTAVAVAGDRIAAVGSDAAVTATGGDRTALIDAQGGLLSAGFDDAHIHFRMGSLALLGVDLFGIHDLSEIQAAIRRYASAHPDLPWVIGRGWMYAAFPGGMPTREQLDAIVADRPTFIDCYDGHTGWANTKALQAAGITRDTPDPVGGEIVRDPATGEPTGALKESATHLVEELQPTPDEARPLDAIRTSLTLVAKAGLTSVQAP